MFCWKRVFAITIIFWCHIFLPGEIWTGVCDTVQETVTKIVPKKKKCKKAKWLSEGALQIAEERREVKSKGERERYTQLNAEFHRIAIEIRRASLINNAKK